MECYGKTYQTCEDNKGVGLGTQQIRASLLAVEGTETDGEPIRADGSSMYPQAFLK
jgi:hypothetical protein